MSETSVATATPTGELTTAAAHKARPRIQLVWADRLLGADPGLNRFLSALHCVVAIAVTMGAEWLFVHWTHALQRAGQPAAVHHELLVVAIMIGAMVAMNATFGVSDPKPMGQAISVTLVAVTMYAAMAMGLAVGSYRVPSLILLALVLAGGTYLRRFGPRGVVAGLSLFMGDFLGFFLHGAIRLSDLGWAAAEIGVGLAATLLVRFTLFYPRPARELRRIQRSYAARARKVARMALQVFDQRGEGKAALTRQLVRLNEAALMIDARLGDPAAVVSGSAQRMHQVLFDSELALTNIARLAVRLAHVDLDEATNRSVREALAAVAAGDLAGARRAAEAVIRSVNGSGHGSPDRAAEVIPHRFASAITAFTTALSDWMTVGTTEEEEEAFQPQVGLAAGWLLGSAVPSAAASVRPGPRRSERALPPYLRTAIQIGVAAGLAIAVGDQISGRRFYWAVIAAFITFMGTNNVGEQAAKAVFRIAGTVIGILVGSVVAHAVGHHTNYSIAVILVSLFLGLYLVRINYALMVVGITVMVSQLYLQLDEFSNSLLVLRLEETALGAALTILTVMLVFPLRTRRVLRVAMKNYLEALSSLVGNASERLLNGTMVALRSDARRVDASVQELIATVKPLRRNLLGDLDPTAGGALALAQGSRHYGRNLVADVEAAGYLDEQTRADLLRGCDVLRTSLSCLVDAVDGPRNVTFVRSAGLFDRAERRLECAPAQGARSVGPTVADRLAIRDLKLLDGTLAEMASAMGMRVAEPDAPALGLDPDS